MQRIAVLYNPLSAESAALSSQVAEWLHARGCEVWRGVSHEGRADTGLECMDLMVALGGDGTVLRAARLAISCGMPVLPVALGRLNFMAELTPADVFSGLELVLAGKYRPDERTLIEATLYASGAAPQRFLALNEMLLARGDINRIVLVDVEIYHTALTTYHADGVIVATATGSTAYALSAGGPIVDPRSRALTLVPVAAHLTNIPSLVLHEDAEITLRLRSRHPAAFSADGRDPTPIHEGDVIEIRRAPEVCVFARVSPASTFYTTMARRLRRAD